MIKPTLKAQRKQLMLADPSVITPDNSPDGKWHMICHSSVGIQHFTSLNGEKWKPEPHLVVSGVGNDKSRFLIGKHGISLYSLYKSVIQGLKTKQGSIDTYLRPFVYKEKDTYYMFYEKRWFAYKGNEVEVPNSQIYMVKSTNLYDWSEPKLVLSSSEKYELVSCPSVAKIADKYTLFFTHGYIVTGDSSLMEPAHLSSLTSDSLDGEFSSFTDYTIVDANDQPVENVGALRCRLISGKLVTTCNIFNKSAPKTVSELYFARITSNVLKMIQPLITKEEWDSAKISNNYVADVVEHDNKIRVYFNIRLAMRLLDGYKVNQTFIGALLLIIQNYLFCTEQIYYKDFDQAEIEDLYKTA